MLKENILGKNQIRAMRALAIFGVITAHGTAVPDTFSFSSDLLSRFIQSIGSMGVGIFFFISGYLLAVGESRKLKFFQFVKRKLSRLALPWLVSSTLVYLYVSIRKGGTLKGFLLSLGGYGSSYWFLSVLFVLLIVYYFILRCSFWMLLSWLMVFASVISVILRGGGYIPINALSVYLNIFNWSIFFSAGILISTASEKISINFFTFRYVFYIITLSVLVFVCVTGKYISYYASYYIFYELAAIFSAVCLSKKLDNVNWLLRLGDISFAIYLWHELPWAGLIANICNRFDTWELVIIRPIIVLAFTSLELIVGYSIFKRFKVSNIYCKVTGYEE